MVYLLVGNELAWCSHPTNKVVQEKNRVMGACSRITFYKGVRLQLIPQFVASKCIKMCNGSLATIHCAFDGTTVQWIKVRLPSSTVRSNVCLFHSVNHNHTYRKWNTREDPIFLTDWECLCLDIAKWRVLLHPRVTMCYEFHNRTWTTQYSWPIWDVCDYGGEYNDESMQLGGGTWKVRAGDG